MKQYEEVFFSVLRTALWGHPLDIPEGFKDWGKVMKLAKTQALTGLVGDVMLTTPRILNSLPEQAVAVLQEIPLNNMAMHTTLNNTLILVVTTLREHGIEPVLLKGQGIASYYPVPQLRQCGDIDLYVGEENYEKAYDVLLPLVSEIDDKEKIWGWMHFHAKVGSALLEIHHELEYAFKQSYKSLFRSRASSGLTENLVTIDFGGLKVKTPEHNFNTFYVFYHLWRHYAASGVGLRQICDWMFLLNARREDVNLEYLDSFIKGMELMAPWQTFGCILVDYLGMPQHCFPFYNPAKRKKAARLLKMILKEGNFGHSGSYSRVRRNSYLYEKWFSFKCHISRLYNMFMIFPYQSSVRFMDMIKEGFRQVFKDLKAKLRK